jgi:DNA replication protein DnaC
LKEIEERNVLTDSQKRIEPSSQNQAKIELTIKETLPRKYHSIATNRKDIFEAKRDNSLFITGMPGTGKTVLACSIAKYLICNEKPVKFISYPAYIMRLQDSFRNENASPFQIAREVARFDGTLIIDDFGAEKLTDYVRQITYFILNEREQWCGPVIITSNYTLGDLDTLVDPRISSRIAGMCDIIKLTGEDRRTNKTKE